MDVDVPTQARGGAGGRRGGRGGSFQNVTRPGPLRAHSSDARKAPYPTSRTASSHTPTAAPVEGKWQHDLFGHSSSLYAPQVNLDAIAARTGKPISATKAAPSLRPFGALTPGPSGPIAIPAPAPAPPPAGETVFSRFGIRGMSGEAEREKLERERKGREQAEQKRRQEVEKRRHDMERQRALAEKESDGFVVQVEGLVFGTSAEDVQTAFGAYGDTSFCFIVNEETANENDDLVARLVFERKKDAEQACQKLNGAIADGKPLRVQLSPATPMPLLSSPPTGPRAVPVVPRNPLTNGVPRGPRAAYTAPVPVRPVVATAPPPPAQRTMYADLVEAVDPRLSGGGAGGDMDVDMEAAPAAIPTGPRGGARGRGRGGRGGFQGVQHAPKQQEQQSLLARFGATQPQQKGGSLLARLG